MPKFNDDISYPFKQNPVIQDSFLMTDSQNQKRTKTVKFEDVFEAIAEYFNNTDSPLSQNNVFRFVEFSVLIGSRFTTIPDETLYEQAVLDKINDAFASLNLTVLQTELIIFKVNVINYGTFNSSQRKYFLPAPLGKGVYEPLSDHITAEQLEVAYIQNSSSGVTPPLVTNVPGMYVFNLGDITIHGLSIINFLNTIEVTEWPNGYDLSDENTIYFFNYELDNVEYLLFFDAEASANGNGFYGAQGDFLFSPSDLIELYNSENPQPIVVNAVPEAPNNGQTYGRKNLTWEPITMTGLVGNINQVLLQGNEIQSDTPIVYTDNGILRTIYQNGQITFIDTVGGDRAMIFGPGFLQSLQSGTPNSYISLVFDTLNGITEYMLTNEPGGVKIIASRSWVNSQIDNQILQLIDGAPVDANTLKRLNDKILALQGIISGTNPDGDSIVNTIAELLAVFQNYPEGTDIAQILADKVNTADVVNNLTTVIAGKVLDARQGKVLADLIAAKWTAVDATSATKGIMKLYTAAGDNTDGAITQKFFNDTVLAKKGIENANYQILATDKWVYTLGNFSANRTFTLPGDAPQGKEIIVADEQGTIGTFTLTIAAPAGKKLNGVTNGTEVIQAAYGWRRFVTDGDGNWFFDAGIVRQAQLTSALAGKANVSVITDISLTATITGCSSFSTRGIRVIDKGNHAEVIFQIRGFSSLGTFTVELPFVNSGVTSIAYIRTINNGVNQTAAGLARCQSGSNILEFFQSGSFPSWGTGADKAAEGQITIQKNP